MSVCFFLNTVYIFGYLILIFNFKFNYMFAMHFRVCLYNIAEAEKSEAKLDKTLSYSVDGKTLTSLKISRGI